MNYIIGEQCNTPDSKHHIKITPYRNMFKKDSFLIMKITISQEKLIYSSIMLQNNKNLKMKSLVPQLQGAQNLSWKSLAFGIMDFVATNIYCNSHKLYERLILFVRLL